MAKCRILADSSSFAKQTIGVIVYLLRSDAVDVDVGSAAIEMLGICCSTHLFVFGVGAIAGVNNNRAAKVVADLLQDGHEVGSNKNGVGSVAAGKL